MSELQSTGIERPTELADLESLASELRARRQALGRTMRSSREYWASVRRLLEIRADLDAAEGRFRELYDFIPVPFLVVDHALHIVSANTAAMALCGADLVATGQHIVTLFDADGFRDISAVLQAGGAPRPIDARLRCERGPVPVQVTVQTVDQNPVEIAGARRHPGRRTYYVAIVDTSHLHALEDERRTLELEQRRILDSERTAREADQAKDEFIAILSHELRTPLTPILAAVGALEGGHLAPEMRDALSMIRRNVLAEARLIDDLLDVARIRQRRLVIDRRPFPLHGLIAEVANDVRSEAERRGISVELQLGGQVDQVEGDPGRIAQVLRNVLGNAVKFCGPSDRITVTTRHEHDRIQVQIDDTGAGMNRDQIERVFQTFAPSRERSDRRAGLGLGLAISRGIVQAHGGLIRVTSPGPSQGTTVVIEMPTVEAGSAIEAADAPRTRAAYGTARTLSALPTAPPLPAAERQRNSKAASTGDSAPTVSRRRVLLVEDHEDSAETLSMVLEMKGYEVLVARSVAEARAAVDGCEIILSDISLPDGSGLDLVRGLPSPHRACAIALSGFGTEEDVRRSMDAGFVEHLVKPVDVDRLLRVLETVCRGRKEMGLTRSS